MDDGDWFKIWESAVDKGAKVPEDEEPHLVFNGVHLKGVSMDDEEWAAIVKTAQIPNHKCLILEISADIVESSAPASLWLPDVLMTAPGAALLIESLIGGFEALGLGPMLDSERDQARASWRDRAIPE